MAPPVLYSTDLSPPCRGVLLALAAAGIKVDVEEVNLRNGDHLKEEFVKMNPQHTIPTVNDNGFFIWDSHAIVTYLVDKYAKDDSLYPKDLQKRAVINQRLHFDDVVLFTSLKGIFFPMFYKGVKTVPQDKLDVIVDAYGFLEKFLGDNDWLAGDTYTLADTSIIASVSSSRIFVPLDKFPKLAAWAKRCEEKIPGYATANAGAVALQAAVKEMLKA